MGKGQVRKWTNLPEGGRHVARVDGLQETLGQSPSLGPGAGAQGITQKRVLW